MRDLYAMSKETGKLVPCEQVIHEFYKTHGALERWTDYWEVTNIEVEGSSLELPDFRKAVRI